MSRVPRCAVGLLTDAGGKILFGENVMRRQTIFAVALAFAWAGGVRAQEAVIAPSENLVTDGITKIPAALAEAAAVVAILEARQWIAPTQPVTAR